jgi:hypothetical protein
MVSRAADQLPPVFGETKMLEQMQLKVCEGCGGLWVRPLVLRGVYCERCYGRLKAFPKAADLRKARPGLKKATLEHRLTLRKLHAVAVAGGAR